MNGVPLEIEVTILRKIPKSYTKKKTKDLILQKYDTTSKGDIDNLVKSIMDSLNGIAYHDDRQISEMKAKKIYTTEEDKVFVSIKELL